MSDFEELERRLSSALDRIGAIVDRGGAVREATGDSGAEAAKVKELEAELAAARAAAAEAEKRAEAAEEALAGSSGASAETDGGGPPGDPGVDGASGESLRRLLAVNQKLRDNNRELRELNRNHVGDPDLINAAALTELDALKAARQADRDELESLIRELTPLAGEG